MTELCKCGHKKSQHSIQKNNHFCLAIKTFTHGFDYYCECKSYSPKRHQAKPDSARKIGCFFVAKGTRTLEPVQGGAEIRQVSGLEWADMTAKRLRGK
jgi:hypothetical protein